MLEGDGAPFHDATARPAEPEEVAAWLEADAPAARGLEIGELVLAPGVPFALDAGGFDRHTFLCGQSGLGQDVLARARPRAAPARDRPAHRHPRPELGLRPPRATCGTARTKGSPRATAAWPGRWSVRTRAGGGRAAPAGASPSSARRPRRPCSGSTRSPTARSTRRSPQPWSEMEAARRWLDLAASGGSRRAQARQPRAENLGVLGWDVWSRGARGLDPPRTQSTRACAASSSTSARWPRARSRRSSAEAVLGRLWERRADRAPVLVVIDEAHNVCPAGPGRPAHRARHRARRAHRRRGPQVRPLPARLDPAPAEGARERALASATTCC